MPKFNIYQIDKSREQDLISKLKNVGLFVINTQKIDNYEYKFLFSKEPDSVKI